MKTQRKLKTFAFLFLFLLVSSWAFSAEECDTVNTYQYQPSGDCETQSRKCCNTGWSAWTTGDRYLCPPPPLPCEGATKPTCVAPNSDILIDYKVNCKCDASTQTYSSCTITPTCAEGYAAVSITVTSSESTVPGTGTTITRWPPCVAGSLCKECGGKEKPDCTIANGTCTWKSCTCNTSTNTWKCNGKNVTCNSNATQVGECCQAAGGPPCGGSGASGVGWKLSANDFSCNSTVGSLSMCPTCNSSMKGAQCVVGTKKSPGEPGYDNFVCKLYICGY